MSIDEQIAEVQSQFLEIANKIIERAPFELEDTLAIAIKLASLAKKITDLQNEKKGIVPSLKMASGGIMTGRRYYQNRRWTETHFMDAADTIMPDFWHQYMKSSNDANYESAQINSISNIAFMKYRDCERQVINKVVAQILKREPRGEDMHRITKISLAQNAIGIHQFKLLLDGVELGQVDWQFPYTYKDNGLTMEENPNAGVTFIPNEMFKAATNGANSDEIKVDEAKKIKQ